MNTDSREQGHDVDGRRGFAIGRPLGIWAGTKSLHKLRYATISLIVAALFVALVGDAMAQTAPTPTLGTAESFGVLGGSTVTNSGPTIVNGDLGVWPGTAVTGFLPGIVVPPGAIHAGDAAALQAQDDVTIAYVDLAGRACDTDLTGTDLGGLTLTSGVYCFSSSAQLTGVLTLDTQGNPDAVFIFQIGSTLTTASNSSVVFVSGEPSCNVFWQVGSSATLGTNTEFVGNIVALTSITLVTDASVTGRVLARNGAVTMDNNTISSCATTTLAVSLSYISSERTGDTVSFVWETATETGNAGFNLYMAVDGGMSLVTTDMVPSSVIDSVVPVGYSYAANVAGDQFYIEMVDISGESELHGPFALGEEYGTSGVSPGGQGMLAHPLFLPVISGW